MKLIKNAAKSNIQVGFEGFDYLIPAGKEVLADEKVTSFLKERYPFLEISKPPKAKGVSPIPQIEKKKSKVYAQPAKPTTDMKVTRKFNPSETVSPDALPTSGTVDKDGVEWVGEGITLDDEIDEDLTKGGVFH